MLHPEEGSDAFSELINTLACGEARIMKALIQWQDDKKNIMAVDDPLPHDFAQATALLFYKATWAKVAHVSATHENAAQLQSYQHKR